MGNAVPEGQRAILDAVGGACGECRSCRPQRTTHVFDVKKERTVPNANVVAAKAALARRGAVVIVATDDGYVKVWISQKGTPFAHYSSYGKGGEVACVSIGEESFHAVTQGRTLPLTFCTGSREGFVTLWELDVLCGMLDPRQQWRAHVSNPSFGQAFAGTSAVALDGAALVTGGADSTVCVWAGIGNGLHRTEVRRVDGAHGGAVTAAAHSRMSSAQEFTVTAGEDGLIKVWGSCADCQLPRHEKDMEGVGDAHSLALDAAHFRCCAGHADNYVRLWDLAAGCATLRFGHVPSLDATGAGSGSSAILGGVKAVGFDGSATNLSRLASGSADGSFCIWDVRAPRPALQKQAHSASVVSVAVEGDSLFMASLDGRASLWDLRSSAQLEKIDLLGDSDGQAFASEDRVSLDWAAQVPTLSRRPFKGGVNKGGNLQTPRPGGDTSIPVEKADARMHFWGADADVD